MSNTITKGFDAKANTLNGNPFVEALVDYAVKYKNHLDSPYADVPFEPKEGTIKRQCDRCFFRVKGDCHCGEKGDLGKLAFGISLDEKMPAQIDGKEVGNFCPYWGDFRCE